MSGTGFSVTLHHNPDCGTSRNTLALIRHLGIEPHVIDVRTSPPSRAECARLIEAAGLTVRDALRTKEAAFRALGLADPALADDALLDAIAREPVLCNRPFVETPLGVRLCRPSERVLDILPPLRTPFVKEDGEVITPEAWTQS